MNIEELKQVAWIGDAYIRGNIRGVVLVFHGLGYCDTKINAEPVELEWARDGWLVVFPYYGPWSWMNRQARGFVDELMGEVYRNYSLSGDLPLVSTGGSMGGFSSLLYTRYARRKIAACLALYPVCDLKAHFYERADLPKTICHAFLGYQESREELFKEHSPLRQVAEMPRIPYLVIHGDKDKAVNKQLHSDKMVQAMREHGLDVEYMEVPGMGHGENMPLAVMEKMIDFVGKQGR